MRKIFLLAFALITTTAYCQYKQTLGYGNANVGYSFKAASPTIAFEAGATSGIIYTGLTGIVKVRSAKNYEPIFIGAIKAGVNIGRVQLFFAPSYQTIGAENEQYYRGTKYAFHNGFYLGGGITYFFNHITVTAQQLGKEFNINAGCYFNF